MEKRAAERRFSYPTDFTHKISLRSENPCCSTKPLTVIGIDNTFACLAISEAARCGGVVRVLDFGGAAGRHYLWVKRALRDIPLRWAVVETASMVREAAPLAREDLRFFVSIAEALSWLGTADVALSIGSLTYAPEPEAVIREIVDSGVRSWVVARQALTFGERLSGPQQTTLAEQGPGPLPPCFEDRPVRYTATFLNHDEFIALLRPHYALRMQTHGTAIGSNERHKLYEFNFMFERNSRL